MILYVVEPRTCVKKNNNKIQIVLENKIIQEVPVNILESIVITGKVIITSGVMEKLLLENITFIWIGYNGQFIGKLENNLSNNITRQYKQFKLYEDSNKKLKICKKFIYGKAKNQKAVLMRYNRNLHNKRIEVIIKDIKYMITKIEKSGTVESLMGIEGYIAKKYFHALGIIVPEEFKFNNRTRRPPKDPVNSVLSFGYSMLFNDMYNIVVSKKLNPYIPTLHSMKNGHPALCSDLMEEWRPIIIDSMVINMFKNGEFNNDDFEITDEGVFIQPNAMRKFIKKYEKKLSSYHKFIDDNGMDYRASFKYQINEYIKTIDEKCDEIIYEPILIR